MMKKVDLYIFAFHATAALVWLALVYPSITSWKDSVPWLVGMSIYANFVNHLTGATLSLIEWLKERKNESSGEG